MAAVPAVIQVLPEGRHSVAGAAWRTPVSQPQSFAGGSEAPRMGLVSHRKTRRWGASPPKNRDRASGREDSERTQQLSTGGSQRSKVHSAP